jgi:hypothetical protein
MYAVLKCAEGNLTTKHSSAPAAGVFRCELADALIGKIKMKKGVSMRYAQSSALTSRDGNAYRFPNVLRHGSITYQGL